MSRGQLREQALPGTGFARHFPPTRNCFAPYSATSFCLARRSPCLTVLGVTFTDWILRSRTVRRTFHRNPGEIAAAASTPSPAFFPSGSPTAHANFLTWIEDTLAGSARCCHAPAVGTCSSAKGWATMPASSSDGATGSPPAAPPPPVSDRHRRIHHSAPAPFAPVGDRHRARRRWTPSRWCGGSGVRWGGSARTVTSLKTGVCSSLIAVCFCFGAGTRSRPHSSGRRNKYRCHKAVIYTYDGWSAVVYFSEEVRDPGKSIPRSIFGRVLSVIAIYLLPQRPAFLVVAAADVAGRSRTKAGRGREHLFRTEQAHDSAGAMRRWRCSSAVNSRTC